MTYPNIRVRRHWCSPSGWRTHLIIDPFGVFLAHQLAVLRHTMERNIQIRAIAAHQQVDRHPELREGSAAAQNFAVASILSNQKSPRGR